MPLQLKLVSWIAPPLLISLPLLIPSYIVSISAQAQTSQDQKTQADILLQRAIEEPSQLSSDDPKNQTEVPNYKVVIPLMDTALMLYREIKDRKGEMNALNHLGMIYARKGEVNIDYLGMIDNAQKEYQQAFDDYQQGLAIAREIKDQRGEIDILDNLKSLLLPMEEALGRYRDDDRRGKMITLNDLGIAYATFGQYRFSFTYYQQGLSIAREIKDRGGEINILNNLRLLYKDREPIERRIESKLSADVKRCRDIRNRQCEMTSLRAGAWSYGGLADYPKEIEYGQQALAIVHEIKDRHTEGLYLMEIANAYSNLNDYLKSIDYYQEALTIFREISDPTSEARILNGLSEAYRASGQTAAAEEYSHLGISLSIPANKMGNERGNHIHLSQGLSQGLSQLQSGKVAEAERILLDTIKWHESWARKATSGDSVKLAYYYYESDAFKLYSVLQKVLIAQNKIEPALEIAERARAKAFSELLAKRLRSTQQSDIKPIQITAIKQVAREQNATLVEYSQINDEQLFIWVVKPRGKVSFRNVDIKSLKQQNTSLDQLVASARCLGIVGCESKVASRQSGKDGVEGVYSPTQSDRLEVSAQKQSTQNSYLQQLYKLIVAPIADLLPADPNAHVIFIPQGSLFLLPFAMLQDTKGKYLIEQHTIITAPSIQVLESTHKLRQQVQQAGRQQVLVVGNPKMPLQLPQLPGAQQEAKVIAALFHTQAIVGGQATKAAIVRQMPNARWIHLATHGILDDQQGFGSAIALAPNGTGETNDGLLTADEILNLKLNAELVVLSACDTGEGRITGDGVLGLSRSLITSGVPSVIVSLWAVNDDSTSQLMRRFYQNLSTGQMTKAEALRQAQLAMLKSNSQDNNSNRSSLNYKLGHGEQSISRNLSHPYYWAPFILIGNGW